MLLQSSTSAEANIVIGNNGTWQDAFQFGQPGDFTWTLVGQGFELEVKLDRYQQSPLLKLSTTSGSIIVDDVNQRVIHFLVPPESIQSSLQPGTYVYDLLMFDASTPSIRTPLMHGTLRIVQGVTVYP